MHSDFYKQDSEGLFSVLRDSWKQAEKAWNQTTLSGTVNAGDINNIIITGLGGSAISGDLLRNFLGHELKVSLSVNRNYTLPGYAGPGTLVITSSYSGNTEETLSAFDDALKKGCNVIAVTTGGEIAAKAGEAGVPVVKMEPGFQPRYALYTSFFTILRVLKDLGFIEVPESLINEMIQMLRSQGEELSTERGKAFETAQKLRGRVPVIYSAEGFNDSAGQRFKGQLNENSKVHAWSAVYPEMNHNEIVGWETASLTGIPYTVISLTDQDMHPRILKRTEIINDLISSCGFDIITLEGAGNSFRLRLMETVYLCDWISYYLALFNEKDPGEIDFIHHLKNRMLEV